MRSTPYSERINPLLRDLHWLRDPERIQLHLYILAFRCLNGSVPPYLAESVRQTADVEGCHHLHSSTSMTLVVPSVQRLTLGDRALPVAALRAWNSLLPAIRTVSSFTSFWQQQKTHLGRIAVYGSTELTLPDDSTHPPDSIYTGLRRYFVA